MGKSKIYKLGKDGLQKLLDESESYASVLEKLGMSRHGHNYKTLNKYIKEFDCDLSKINKNRKQQRNSELHALHNKKLIPLEDIINGEYKQKYKGSKLKDRLIKAGYKTHQCERCGLTEWLGNPIPLQLHHKDGDHDNNLIENIELLCPNCHSLTDTFAGKNIKNKKNKRINKDDSKDMCPICGKNLKQKKSKMCSECYKEERNKQLKEIDRDLLKNEIRIYPMTVVGKNHMVSDNTIRKWCKKLNLPYKVKEIKKITDEDWINI